MDSLANIVQIIPFLGAYKNKIMNDAIESFCTQEIPLEPSQPLRYYNSKTGSFSILAVVDSVQKMVEKRESPLDALRALMLLI